MIGYIIGLFTGGIVGIFFFHFLEIMIIDFRNGRRDNFLVWELWKRGIFREYFNRKLKLFRQTHTNWRTAELGTR